MVCGIGLYFNIILLTPQKAFSYYTVQSNLVCFIFYFVIVILELIKKLKKNDFYYMTKGAITMAITLTMFGFQTILLSDGDFVGYQNHELECVIVHLIVPLMVIVDYLMFGEKGHLKKNYPFIWSLILIYYTFFDIVYVSFGGTFMDGTKYPYFYMNLEKYGLIGVSINCLVIYIAFVFYGIIIRILDNKVSKIKIRKVVK